MGGVWGPAPQSRLIKGSSFLISVPPPVVANSTPKSVVTPLAGFAQAGRHGLRRAVAAAPRPPRSLRTTSSTRGCFGAPASRAALEHVTVMKNAVEHGGDRRHVTQQFAPVFDWPI